MNAELKKFNYLVSETDSVYHDIARHMGISDSTMNVLYSLHELGDGAYQRDIYKLYGSSRQTVNSSIRKMVKDGLIYLKDGEGRHVRVFLTDEGKSLQEQTVLPLINAENEIFESWTAEERSALIRLTKKYLDDIKSKIPDIIYNNNKEDNY